MEMIKRWFISFVLLTLISGFVFITVQQLYRKLANDPQVAIANDTVSQLSEGKTITPKSSIDIATAQAPFTIIYNENGDVLSSEAKLDNQTPKLPGGVLSSTKRMGENRVTWQPKEGVRIATVIKHYDHGYVLVGRSLAETENRISDLTQTTVLFWVGSNVFMFILFTLLKKGK